MLGGSLVLVVVVVVSRMVKGGWIELIGDFCSVKDLVGFDF
jgi:hypothetical protein